MSLPFARLNDSNKTQTFESGITFSIEDIDRELAKKYLAMNLKIIDDQHLELFLTWLKV